MSLELEPTKSEHDYERIVKSMSARLDRLPSLDYDMLRAELSKLNVRLSEQPTLDSMSSDMQRIQAAKDRANEIVKDAVTNFLVRKRVTEILVMGWMKFSEEKSSDKREAEAQLKLSQFLMDAVEAESFFKTATHIMANLQSQQDTISRQVTCFSLLLKTNDVRFISPEDDLRPGHSDSGENLADEMDKWSDRS